METVSIKFSSGKYQGVLELHSKFTFLRGKSAIGKTAVAEFLGMSETQIQINPGWRLVPFPQGRIYSNPQEFKWFLESLSHGDRTVLYCDEDISYIRVPEVQKVMQESDAIYLIINRDTLAGLSYSIADICDLVCEKGVQYRYSLRRPYANMVYLGCDPEKCVRVMTEDKRSLNTLLR